MGDAENDPMSAMGGMSKLSVMLATGEIDVLITDEDHARQFGESGEAFVALSEMFTEDEISAFTGESVGVPVFDDNGDLTSEMSAPCGIILSENASALAGISGLQIHVFDGTKDMDAAKAVMKHLASIK